MNRAAHPPETRNPEELERDIDRTRSSLGRTIDELENRLSPGQLIDQALSMGRRHGGELAANLGRSVENNPLPLLLTAVGIAWMMMSSNEPRAGRRADTADWDDLSPEGGRFAGTRDKLEGGMETARSAAGAVGERASRARDAIGHTVSHTGERMRYAGERMRAGSGRLREGFLRLLEEQPLLVGAIGLAVGAAIGAALPRTEQEDRLLGETSDSAARKLKERAGDAYEEVRERAGELLPGQEMGSGEAGAGIGQASLGSEQPAMQEMAEPGGTDAGDFEVTRRH
jgi:ElaB/YqjD/DUF883 family membrane-anchored ribosome-binding protein